MASGSSGASLKDVLDSYHLARKEPDLTTVFQKLQMTPTVGFKYQELTHPDGTTERSVEFIGDPSAPVIQVASQPERSFWDKFWNGAPEPAVLPVPRLKGLGSGLS